jgi:hypothetical protein
MVTVTASDTVGHAMENVQKQYVHVSTCIVEQEASCFHYFMQTTTSCHCHSRVYA